ncbi:MAG: helix-turn-helix transcriptional regulator [Lachnospiraceae bacterium]|nr:helix-turn-helix transcriptional regulator [Lachnospiraceae bacterium]
MINKRLGDLVVSSGKTQFQIAKELNISPQRFNFYVTGKREPDNEMLNSLANYFSVSADYLLGRSSKKEPAKKDGEPKTNTVKIAGRDGTFVEKKLSDDQINALKLIIEQMPDATDPRL